MGFSEPLTTFCEKSSARDLYLYRGFQIGVLRSLCPTSYLNVLVTLNCVI